MYTYIPSIPSHIKKQNRLLVTGISIFIICWTDCIFSSYRDRDPPPEPPLLLMGRLLCLCVCTLVYMHYHQSPLTTAQTTEDWRIPEVIKPVRPIQQHGNISMALRRYPFITLHVPKGYFPNAFFLFIHMPKNGGTTFNVRSCPRVLSHCGSVCGCGNCESPYFYSGERGEVYPVLNDFMSGTCPLLSFEIDYSGFEWAYNHPVPYKGRTLYAMTLIRNPYNYIKSQLGHYISHYRSKFTSGDRSPLTVRCMEPIAHFNRSNGCTPYHLENGQTFWMAQGNLEKGIDLLQKMWGVGITEYHEESMCLFQYQLNQFNRRRCNCEYILKLKKTRSSKIWKTKNMGLDEDLQIRHVMISNTRQDLKLWSAALKIFAHRIKYVEQEMGVKIICDDNFFSMSHNDSFMKVDY